MAEITFRLAALLQPKDEQLTHAALCRRPRVVIATPP